MSAEEVTEEVEALIAILEEDTVEVVKGEDGERPKVKHQSQHFPMHLLAVMLTAVMYVPSPVHCSAVPSPVQIYN